MDTSKISNRHNKSQMKGIVPIKDKRDDDLVLYKPIFSDVFHKDIRRAYIYKKADRLGRALYLIAPAFRDSAALRARAESLALSLPASALEERNAFRDALSRELLALASLLSMARAGNLLSPMNATIIEEEVHTLLEDVAAYEEPHVALADMPALAELTRRAHVRETVLPRVPRERTQIKDISDDKGHSSRQERILALIKEKGSVSIRDISALIVDISGKTIQRELQALVSSGELVRRGERRWSVYSLT